MVPNEHLFKVTDTVEFICDRCEDVNTTTLKNVRSKRKKFGLDICTKCAYIEGASKRPQNTVEYWKNDKIKENHSKSIKQSEIYRESIIGHSEKFKGENNPMFGRKHTDLSKDKMSKTRKDKKQSSETVEKRAKTIKHINNLKRSEKDFININKQIRTYIHCEIKWYKRIYERDNYRCRHCNSNEKLDAHHIVPLSRIIKELVKNKEFKTELEKYNYLITEPRILDTNLENGIALCRKCHKEVHRNWGSHKQ
jgi:hypothetical protein